MYVIKFIFYNNGKRVPSKVTTSLDFQYKPSGGVVQEGEVEIPITKNSKEKKMNTQKSRLLFLYYGK